MYLLLIKWVAKCRVGVNTSSLLIHVMGIWFSRESFNLTASPKAHQNVFFSPRLLMNKTC